MLRKLSIKEYYDVKFDPLFDTFVTVTTEFAIDLLIDVDRSNIMKMVAKNVLKMLIMCGVAVRT